jgi:hypothetical protein
MAVGVLDDYKLIDEIRDDDEKREGCEKVRKIKP